MSNLRQFGDWVGNSLDRFITLESASGMWAHGAKTECLYLKPPFKVDRVTIPAKTMIPRHRHPHVSSFEIYLSGYGAMFLRDRSVLIEGGKPGYLKAMVPRNWWHGGYAHVETRFLSVQEWSGPVGDILEDWDD